MNGFFNIFTLYIGQSVVILRVFDVKRRRNVSRESVQENENDQDEMNELVW